MKTHLFVVRPFLKVHLQKRSFRFGATVGSVFSHSFQNTFANDFRYGLTMLRQLHGWGDGKITVMLNLKHRPAHEEMMENYNYAAPLQTWTLKDSRHLSQKIPFYTFRKHIYKRTSQWINHIIRLNEEYVTSWRGVNVFSDVLTQISTEMLVYVY